MVAAFAGQREDVKKGCRKGVQTFLARSSDTPKPLAWGHQNFWPGCTKTSGLGASAGRGGLGGAVRGGGRFRHLEQSPRFRFYATCPKRHSKSQRSVATSGGPQFPKEF
eukprot:gene12184-biopygen10973